MTKIHNELTEVSEPNQAMLKNTAEDRRNKKIAFQKCVRQWANSTLETEIAMDHAWSSALETNATQSAAWH